MVNITTSGDTYIFGNGNNDKVTAYLNSDQIILGNGVNDTSAPSASTTQSPSATHASDTVNDQSNFDTIFLGNGR